jgi:hypothetical protein
MIPILLERPRLWRALQAIPEVTNDRVAEFKLRHGYIVWGLVAGIVLGATGAGLAVSCFWTSAFLPWGLLGLSLGLAAASWLLLVRQLASLRVLVPAQGFAILTLGVGNAQRCYRIEEPLAAPVNQPGNDPSTAAAQEQPAPAAAVAAGPPAARMAPSPAAFPESCNPSPRSVPGQRHAPAVRADRRQGAPINPVSPRSSTPGPRQL